ncbi:type VII secretion-associated serine protease mycosin [Streptomyces sp. So13.3]|nr:type VII secretion-associated serine protease mycosin [Streptomyces sp. So13.3]
MGLAAAWKISEGKDITVAVIDSGVDRTAPDLRGQLVVGRDFGTKPVAADIDLVGHGTSMASLIAGTGEGADGSGVVGVAPKAKILPLRLPDNEGEKIGAAANPEFYSELVKAIRYAADSDARVISISLGDSGIGDAAQHQSLQEAVDFARSKGKLIFAAAGNSGDGGSPVEYPAATRGVVGVAALGKDVKAIPTSTKGPQVDLSAAGNEIIGACPTQIAASGYCKGTGTSPSTALASGSAALLWSAHPTWTANQVLRVLLNTAGAPTSGAKRNDSIGYGAVRPRVALQTPGDPGAPDVYPLAAYEAQTAPNSPVPSESAAAPAPSATAPAAQAEATSDASDSGNTVLWFGFGGAAVVIAATAVLVVRNRNRLAAPPGPPPAPPYGSAPPPTYETNPQHTWQQGPPAPPQ